MTDFRDRLRSIRENAEKQASRLQAQSLHGRGGGAAESAAAQRFRDLSQEIGEAIEELAKNFVDELEGFEHIRVTMEGGHCVRISKLEDIEGTRKLSRLTFNIETLELLPEEVDTPRGLHISCKGIVFNRERGHDEVEIDFFGSEGGSSTSAAREFAERNLLEFASAYEQARMTTTRPDN